MIAGGMDKAMGARKGVPDYLVRLPGGRLGWLEAKRYTMPSKGAIKKTYPSPAQQFFLADAATRGERTGVFRTADEGIKLLEEWLDEIKDGV